MTIPQSLTRIHGHYMMMMDVIKQQRPKARWKKTKNDFHYETRGLLF